MSIQSPTPIAFGDFGQAAQPVTPANRLPVADSAVLAALNAIGSDATPVPVTANLKAGLGAYAQFGAPSAGADNITAYSTPFVPNGEKLSLQLQLFKSGLRAINLAGGGKVWLEADLSGGVNYRPVLGSLVPFADMAAYPGASTSGIVLPFAVRPYGNWRLAVSFGTTDVSAGSTGNVGFNVFLLN